MTIATRPAGATGNFLLAAERLETLRARMDGDLITAERAGYDEARKVQDVTVDVQPLAIARAAHAGDVSAAVTFARAHDLPIVVRSGGHSLAQYSMEDDVLVIDLSGLRGITIDPQTRVARVQGGVTSADLGAAAAKHGLALTTGDTATVGIGGLGTGGGIGYMVRKYGLTIDSLLEAEVVTASGEIVTAGPDSHPDLFWAIRGGGGNFGIVTEFTFRLAPVPQILGGVLLLPASREIVRGYLDYTVSAPEELSTIANLILAPPAPFVPEEWVGKPVTQIIVIWSGSIEDGERAVAPLRALAEPVADLLSPMPYPAIYQFTAHQELRHGVAIRSMFADALSDETIDASLAAIAQASSPYSLIHLRGLGGALGRVAPEATAFAHRDARYLFGVIAVWLDPTEDPEPHRAWTNALWQQVRHEGKGVYVNFLQREGPERIHDAYPPATYARLAAIKRAYDPDNVFKANQNIAPA